MNFLYLIRKKIASFALHRLFLTILIFVGNFFLLSDGLPCLMVNPVPNDRNKNCYVLLLRFWSILQSANTYKETGLIGLILRKLALILKQTWPNCGHPTYFYGPWTFLSLGSYQNCLFLFSLSKKDDHRRKNLPKNFLLRRNFPFQALNEK